MPAPIARRRQYDDTRSRNRKQQLTANDDADGTNKRGGGERSYPRGRTQGTFAFAALPFGTYQ
jgi:hypothetical protein